MFKRVVWRCAILAVMMTGCAEVAYAQSSGCDNPPLVGGPIDGPRCSVARQLVECGCSEWFAWEKVDDPRVVGYIIERRGLNDGVWAPWKQVGLVPVRHIIHGFMGKLVSVESALRWMFAWDEYESFPYPPGKRYEYRVVAYGLQGLRGVESGSVGYVVTTWVCWDHQGMVVECRG